MKGHRLVPLVVVAGTLLLLPSAAWAQSTGSIAGLVTDATGAVLPGVTVETASPALIERLRTASTDAQGRYLIEALPPVYDYGGGFGGPIKRDKLWFYTAHRWWGSQEWAAGKFYNKTQGAPLYTPDLSRPAHSDFYQQDNSGRVKWQATPKQTYTFSLPKQHNCNCNLYLDFGAQVDF
jgi:carboxypeptidase family protein